MADVPNHIAIIPDGNRRYARQQGMPAWEGHRAGANVFEELLKWCKEFKIKELSFWAASTENLEREKMEVDFLINLFVEMCDKFLKDDKNELKENKVRIRFIGNREKLPEKLIKRIGQVEEKTRDYSDYKLNMLVGYGGRWEITQAAKKIAEEVKQGKLKIDDITPDVFQKHLILEDEPDLVIRTSEERLSGFLPWQCIYSEIIFIKDKYWPEFTKQDFKKCLDEYASRKRRFGK
jgi:tritrans,polycis-undecaprenyl-diphosphate synthase [geranylgeranyl-diphosphate specific]